MVRVEFLLVFCGGFENSELQFLGVLPFFELVNLDEHLFEFRLHLFEIPLDFRLALEQPALFLQLPDPPPVLLLVLLALLRQSLQPRTHVLLLELQLVQCLVLVLLYLKNDLVLALLQCFLHVLCSHLFHQTLLALADLP